MALSRGHRAIGIDIDPLAVMLSRVAVTPIDTVDLLAAGKSAISRARRVEGLPPWGKDAETNTFVDYWFGKEQKRALVALASAISASCTGEIRQALEVAISRIIVTKSPHASLAADTSHSRPHKVIQESDYDVFAGFEQSLLQLAQRLQQRARIGGARVLLGDSRKMPGIKASSIDISVTSPPYLNALDYLRGHKLALVWFGHTVGELRDRRAMSIGSERALESRASDLVAQLVLSIEASLADKTRLKRGMVERFAHDCVQFARELFRVVRPGGTAVLVVGNSTLRGNYIHNDAIAQQAMEAAGFVLRTRYEREIPPSMRYMPINTRTQSKIGNRMRTEVVLTMGR